VHKLDHRLVGIRPTGSPENGSWKTYALPAAPPSLPPVPGLAAPPSLGYASEHLGRSSPAFLCFLTSLIEPDVSAVIPLGGAVERGPNRGSRGTAAVPRETLRVLTPGDRSGPVDLVGD
jgi:hypothetical protein